MKNLCAIAFAAASALGTATVHAAPETTAVFATWHMADLHDVTQAWYFTGAALSSHDRGGAPWAGERPLVQPAEVALSQAPLQPAPLEPAPLEPAPLEPAPLEPAPLEPSALSALPELPVAPAVPAVPARVDVPPTIPEPRMAPMLLLGLLLLFLRANRKEEQFG
ncbi:hypothetical protein [Pseudoduganella albidiflava]|uniref:PEP-CTERM sorting domain-containing protein n=1 Tax=Pseudoduganella albidiflava TaxID=321983 RepID=A0A411X2M4_9BURK|nr:hypothetical protein [Pseudoduganella albidiflava]QBI03143.1 hypothetical protein EYF70_21630 [Pseudoduganella albidiflava]GGY64892.1 hypothetical protein GCM10007387_54140 [Pseudoduganella albidiflava]